MISSYGLLCSAGFSVLKFLCMVSLLVFGYFCICNVLVFVHCMSSAVCHTHTTILRPSWILSGTIRVSRHQKGNTRKVDHSGSYAYLHLDPDTTAPGSHHSVFYRPDALPVTQPRASKQPGICVKQ